MNGSSYVKFALRKSTSLNFQNDDEYCFIWLILASFHPCENNHPNRVSIYGQKFIEINFQGFDFSNGFKCSGVQNLEKLIDLSKKILN